MITHTINSYLIPFISSQNYIMWGYNYKSIDLTKPGIYVKDYINYHICTKYESSCIKNDLRNSKKVQFIY